MSNARSPVGPQRRPIDVFPWRRASCRRDGRQLLRDWLMLALLSILVFAFPVRTTITREAAILLGVLTWISGMILFRRSAGAWAVSIALAAGIAWVALAPGKAINGNALQAQYVMCLKTYRGTRYVWGGENCLGIDCSGLVRQGMIMATLREGLATGNPGLVRESVFIWYHDCTAEMLGEGYGGRTISILETPSLKELVYSRICPGDIAVTDSGVHTLAYIGHRTWIEADPEQSVGFQVIEVSAVNSPNVWLTTPMQILRWKILTRASADPTV